MGLEKPPRKKSLKSFEELAQHKSELVGISDGQENSGEHISGGGHEDYSGKWENMLDSIKDSKTVLTVGQRMKLDELIKERQRELDPLSRLEKQNLDKAISKLRISFSAGILYTPLAQKLIQNILSEEKKFSMRASSPKTQVQPEIAETPNNQPEQVIVPESTAEEAVADMALPIEEKTPSAEADPEAVAETGEDITPEERIEGEARWMTQRAEEIYFKLADEVRENGIHTADVPAWKEAYKAYQDLKLNAAAYKEAKTTEQQDGLLKRFYAGTERLENQISRKVQMDTARVVAKHPARPETPLEKKTALKDAVEKVSALDMVPSNTVNEDSPAAREAEDAPESISISETGTNTPSISAQEESLKYKNNPLNLTGSEDSNELILGDPERLHLKLVELARETRGVEGAKQFERRNTNEETFLAHSASALAMLEAEKKYLDSYRLHKKNQGMGATLASKFIDTDKFLPEHLKNKKAEWMKERSQYLASMNSSLDTKMDSREKENAEHKDGRKGYDRFAVQERYERRFSKSIVDAGILGAEKAEQDTRIDALDKRSKSNLEVMFDKYQKIPAHIRIPLTFGAMTAVSAGAAALTGGAIIGLGAFATAGSLVGARAALGKWAENAKDPNTKKTLTSLSFILSPGAWGKYLGEKSVRTIHENLGTEKDAKKTLSKAYSMRDFTDVARTGKVIEKRNKANVQHENIERQAALAGAIGGTATAVGLGGIFGTFFRGLFGQHSAMEVPTAHTAQENVTPGVHLATLKEYAETGHASTGISGDQFGTGGDTGLTAENVSHATHLGHVEAPAHAVASPEHVTHTAQHHAPAHAERPLPVHAAPLEKPVSQEPVHLTDADRKLIQEWESENGGLPPHADQHLSDVLDRLHQNDGPDAFKDVHYDAEVPQAPVPEAHTPQPTESHVDTPEAAATQPAESHEAPPEPAATHDEASVSPADTSHTEHVPTNTVHESSAEPFYTQSHHILVDPRTPHAYSYQGEDGTSVTAIYGGKGEEGYYAAEQYAKSHPGSTVRFEAWSKEPSASGDQHYTGMAVSDAKGTVAWYPGSETPSPAPERLLSRLDFDYKPKS
ncbi:MAG: hypothetical protein JWL88_553 [Parcubacteria group bacterium]|nr:hypothetical protein [Parcubacteria group bacterium]